MASEPKVSVVVPVFNPGHYIDRCIDSLLSQTIAPSDLELIFVDDGSTDDTLARLRVLAEAHEHIRVIAIPNSGWPGKPRNVGTDHARGEYVMYVDQDDCLGPEAFDRMYDLGSANGSDIVLGKVTSDFRGVHHYLYRQNRARCTVYDSRLINSQTPHKMLRRQFLIDHGLRYPEGRRRLEDQLFITRAYFAARSCSIVADYPCYRYLQRSDHRNAGSQRVEPASYFANLRDVLDVVDAHTPPGPVRDGFYRRFLRVELLGKLSGGRITRTPMAAADRWMVPIRELAQERIPLSVDAGLPVTMRLRSHLMRSGTFADLKDLTARTRTVQPAVRVSSQARTDDGLVRLSLSGDLTADDVPVPLEPDGSGGWLLPLSLTGAADPADRRIEDAASMQADLVVIHASQGDEWFIDRPLSIAVTTDGPGPTLGIRGDPAVDPATAAGGRPLPAGRHDLSIRLDALGLTRLRPLRVAGASLGRTTTISVISGSPRTLLSATPSGQVFLEVAVSAKRVRAQVHPIAARWEGGRLTVELGTGWLASAHLHATLTRPRGKAITLRLSPTSDAAATWRSEPRGISPGTYRLRIKLPQAGAIDVQQTVDVRSGPVMAVRALVGRLAGAWR